jgi:hypothetical protein
MDRYDEKKDQAEDIESPRTGDVLGLGGSPVPKAPGDPTASHDPAAAAKRRARMHEEESSGRTEEHPASQGGSTAIDMGAGGEGPLIRDK